MYAFFQSAHFLDMPQVPGAHQTLTAFAAGGLAPSESKRFNFVLVTSRQHFIRNETIRWLNRHFPQIFYDIRFGNHYGASGVKMSKPDMCRLVGACALIDDNLDYALQCAALPNFWVLLFDFNRLYKWNRLSDTGRPLPPNITRVFSWEEVGQQLRDFPAPSPLPTPAPVEQLTVVQPDGTATMNPVLFSAPPPSRS